MANQHSGDNASWTSKSGLEAVFSETLGGILLHLDYPSILSLSLTTKFLRGQLTHYISAAEARIIEDYVGLIDLERLKKGADRRKGVIVPNKDDISSWFLDQYPAGLVIPDRILQAGFDNALRRRKETLGYELLGIDWTKISRIELDPCVLVVLPFLIARSLLLVADSDLLRDVTPQTVAWITLPLQQSTEIFARVLSLNPAGAAFVAGSYLGLSFDPGDYGCEPLDDHSAHALWYSLGGKYAGWTWRWHRRWASYASEVSDPAGSSRTVIAHFRKVARTTSSSNLHEVLKPFCVAFAPDAIAASVGARYGIETLIILAQHSLSSGNPGLRQFMDRLREDQRSLKSPFMSRGIGNPLGTFNMDVPIACRLLHTEDDSNSRFT
ncbi:uncharacterized protein JCM6883_003856 [Sporobolomyces salmoneus]|uniref:uncharacterized protein n=1 Tax=Sporobolomyces salmoneus TaxID=183962 RepID=UPI0031809150